MRKLGSPIASSVPNSGFRIHFSCTLHTQLANYKAAWTSNINGCLIHRWVQGMQGMMASSECFGELCLKICQLKTILNAGKNAHTYGGGGMNLFLGLAVMHLLLCAFTNIHLRMIDNNIMYHVGLESCNHIIT